MIAVIAGATGLVGSHLLTKLLESKDIEKVIAVGRRKTGVHNPKLEEIVTPEIHNLSPVREALRGDAYFCCLGTTIKVAGSKEKFSLIDHDAVLEFGKTAKSHSAKNFVLVSATGADANSMFFYNRVKGQTEDDLKALGLNRLVIFRPALLMGPRQEKRLVEQGFARVMEAAKPLIPDAVGKRLMTEAGHLAARMLELAGIKGDKVEVLEAANI